MKTLRKIWLISMCGIIVLGTFSFTTNSKIYQKIIPVPYPTEIDTSTIRYSICLGEFSSLIPVKDTQRITSISGAKGIKGEDGVYRFYSPPFKTQKEANMAYKEYSKLGFKNHTLVVSYQGNYYTMDEFASF